MLKISGSIGDKRFDNQIIDQKEAIALFELEDYIKPLIDNFGHIEFSYRTRRRDSFGQPIAQRGNLWLNTQKGKGKTPRTKTPFDVTLTFFELIKSEARGNRTVQVHVPVRSKFTHTNVFVADEDGLINQFDKLFPQFFNKNVSSILSPKTNSKFEFKNPFKTKAQRLTKVQKKIALQQAILKLSEEELKYRAYGIGVNGGMHKDLVLETLLMKADEDMPSMADFLDTLTFAKGFVTCAINDKVIEVKSKTTTTKVWGGVPSLEGIATSLNGEDSLQIINKIGSDKINSFLAEISSAINEGKSKDVAKSIDMSVLRGKSEPSGTPETNKTKSLIQECFETGVLWHNAENNTIYRKHSKGNDPVREGVTYENKEEIIYQELLNDSKLLNQLRMGLMHAKKAADK